MNWIKAHTKNRNARKLKFIWWGNHIKKEIFIKKNTCGLSAIVQTVDMAQALQTCTGRPTTQCVVYSKCIFLHLYKNVFALEFDCVRVLFIHFIARTHTHTHSLCRAITHYLCFGWCWRSGWMFSLFIYTCSPLSYLISWKERKLEWHWKTFRNVFLCFWHSHTQTHSRAPFFAVIVFNADRHLWMLLSDFAWRG